MSARRAARRGKGRAAGGFGATVCGIVLLGLPLGWAPSIAAAQPFAYVANFDTDDVSVVDTATNSVVATVDVGASPFGVAVTLMGTRAYVTNFGGSSVSVIEAEDNTVIKTIPVGLNPVGVAVASQGLQRAYVANSNDGTVSIVDMAKNIVVGSVVVGATPFGVALTPDGAFAYVTNAGSGTVSVIDTADTDDVDPHLAATVSVGVSPLGVAAAPGGAFVYVANEGSGNLSVIDTATNTVAATVTVGTQPVGVAVRPDTTRVYVANRGTADVSVIDTATNTVVATVSVPGEPYGVVVVPDGSRVYVANRSNDEVTVIDTATNAVARTVPVGGNPQAVGQFVEPPGCGDGVMAPGEACDDGNQVDGDCCSSACTLEFGPCEDGDLGTCHDMCVLGACVGTTLSSDCPDLQKCYRAKDLRNPRFVGTTVDLADQFSSEQGVPVRRPLLVCNPASLNGQPLNNPDNHMACYRIKPAKLTDAQEIRAITTFGPIELRLKKALLLCVPSQKTVLP